jgi:hypothetical protein
VGGREGFERERSGMSSLVSERARGGGERGRRGRGGGFARALRMTRARRLGRNDASRDAPADMCPLTRRSARREWARPADGGRLYSRGRRACGVRTRIFARRIAVNQSSVPPRHSRGSACSERDLMRVQHARHRHPHARTRDDVPQVSRLHDPLPRARRRARRRGPQDHPQGAARDEPTRAPGIEFNTRRRQFLDRA